MNPRKRIEIQGIVQGVGFRPFVYRSAIRTGIHGHVLNSSGGVVIEAQGQEPAIQQFLEILRTELPPLARIDQLTVSGLEPHPEAGFSIHSSAPTASFTPVPPDAGICADCRREMEDPGDRRFGYPFINCTNCGPRYTIIQDVPYDRAHTTMAPFRMCARCNAEYDNPAGRRFHAEPNSCPDCGPSFTLISGGTPDQLETTAALFARVQDLLRGGQIVAIKGVGGFHLACDASSDCAVSLLRHRKRRSGKAFAVMVRDLDVAERLCEIAAFDRDLLSSPARPIVILPAKDGANVAADVAPGVATLGLMLPYAPLHHLLFAPDLDALVMTSGNLAEEPIASGNDHARSHLAPLSDHFLIHNREIHARADDSVLQVFENREYPVRRSRGYAPDPIALDQSVHPILACGGELKNTLCLAKDRHAILSQHIGDLQNEETMTFFRQTRAHLERFFRVSPVAVAHDLHPNYLSTRFALEESGLTPIGVQHHHAHIASCMADNSMSGHVIGVAFDGTGYGPDGRIWGGEFLSCGYAGFKRQGHLRYVPLAGGDQSVRQPWRAAIAYLRDAFGSDTGALRLPLFDAVPGAQVNFVQSMLDRGVQTMETSSCGRLFDAVASILGVCQENTYEGQAAIELEAAADGDAGSYPFQIEGDDTFQIDLRPMIAALVHDFARGIDPSRVAGRFHRTLSRVISLACSRIRAIDGLNRVCLSGGTFHNLRLMGLAAAGLRAAGFEVFVHHRVPPNDAGLSLGQALVANATFCMAKT